jgi:hypothetical protein
MTSAYPLDGAALPPPPAPVPPRRPRWVVPLLAAVALVLVAGTAVTTWALTRDTRALPPAAPAAIAIDGTLELDGVVGPGWKVGVECWGNRGYDDIREGAQVTVTDRDGAVLALGRLLAGVVTDDPRLEGAKTCVFGFTVLAVPAGKGIYGVEVAHRGIVRFEEAKLAAAIGLTLG